MTSIPIVLWLEGRRRRATSDLIHKVAEWGFKVIRVSTGKEAFARFEQLLPHVIVINAPSMGSSGARLARKFYTAYPHIPIILVHDSEFGVKRLPASVELHPANAKPRCLLSRLRRLTHPGPLPNCLELGPFRLDLDQRCLMVHDKVYELTPKMTRLMQVLMERAGYAIAREDLFREVWQTDFTGDTRTLDVHISWLRRAIEPDPRHPQYLRTLRGRGYILDLASNDGYAVRARPCQPRNPTVEDEA